MAAKKKKRDNPLLKDPAELTPLDMLDDRKEVTKLFKNLKKQVTAFVKLLEECSDWHYDDRIYRFYHQSFKVYALQQTTLNIVRNLQKLAPSRPLNEWFMRIVREGTGKEWKREDNKNWLEVTRPILEAFFHARYFLEMAVKYGQGLEYPSICLPSGWAAFLYLYNMR